MFYNSIPGYTLLGYGEAIPPPGGRPPGPCAADPLTGKTSCPEYNPTAYYIGWAAVVGTMAFILFKTLTMKTPQVMTANARPRRASKKCKMCSGKLSRSSVSCLCAKCLSEPDGLDRREPSDHHDDHKSEFDAGGRL